MKEYLGEMSQLFEEKNLTNLEIMRSKESLWKISKKILELKEVDTVDKNSRFEYYNYNSDFHLPCSERKFLFAPFLNFRK